MRLLMQENCAKPQAADIGSHSRGRVSPRRVPEPLPRRIFDQRNSTMCTKTQTAGIKPAVRWRTLVAWSSTQSAVADPRSLFIYSKRPTTHDSLHAVLTVGHKGRGYSAAIDQNGRDWTRGHFGTRRSYWPLTT